MASWILNTREKWMHALKRITSKGLLSSTGNLAQCGIAAWMGGEFGGEWIHAYVRQSPFAVCLNYHNNVNWLHSNIKEKLLKRNGCMLLFITTGRVRVFLSLPSGATECLQPPPTWPARMPSGHLLALGPGSLARCQVCSRPWALAVVWPWASHLPSPSLLPRLQDGGDGKSTNTDEN